MGPEQQLANLLARQHIQDMLARYCRALDRMDKAMAYSIWHPGGTALYHDIFDGTGEEFVDWVWEAHANMERHSHQITNTLITVDDDTAASESYVTVALWTNPDEAGSQQEIVGRGRYLDRWAKRDGRWAIDHREHVLDMQTIHPLVRGGTSAASARDESDPSFAYIPAHR